MLHWGMLIDLLFAGQTETLCLGPSGEEKKSSQPASPAGTERRVGLC